MNKVIFGNGYLAKFFVVVGLIFLLNACSPHFDWREIRPNDAPYSVLLPSKPNAISRDILLGDQKVVMTMQAAQIDGVSFAVGAAKLPDPTQAQIAIDQIKEALVTHLAGRIIEQKSGVISQDNKPTFVRDFEALSTTQERGAANRIIGHIAARDTWVFQVLIVGPDKAINREAVETFISSFKALN